MRKLEPTVAFILVVVLCIVLYELGVKFGLIKVGVVDHARKFAADGIFEGSYGLNRVAAWLEKPWREQQEMSLIRTDTGEGVSSPEVPGTGSTVSELRSLGWSDQQIEAMMGASEDGSKPTVTQSDTAETGEEESAG